MLNRIRKTISEKGQGLTEYVLILAFIAGIGLMFTNGGLKNTLVGTHTETVRILGGLLGDVVGYVSDYASALKNWGNKSDEELKKIDNEKRLTIDEEALANLAGYFIGKKKEDLYPGFKPIDNDIQKTVKTNNVFLLGHLTNNENGGTDFVASGEQLNETGMAEVNAHIFNWLQKDYGDGGYVSSNNSDRRYLFSDYALDNDTGSKFTTTDNKKYDRGGIKVKLAFDTSDTVIAAKVVMDSMNNKGEAGSNSSKGLCVTKIWDRPATVNDDFNTNFNRDAIVQSINNN